MSQPSHQSLVYRGALGVVDVWPLELTLESTEFLHSQTLGMGQHDWVLWQPFTGSERRSGFSSVVHKRTHYDGGREPEGLGGMVNSAHNTLDPVDDPGAVTNVTTDGVTFVNHGAILWGISFLYGFWPPMSNQHRQINWRAVDTVQSEARALNPGDVYDGSYTFVPVTHTVTERTRFEHSGNFDPDAHGMGGLQIWAPDSVLATNRPSARFVNTVWVGNAAGVGPAVALQSGQADFAFDMCLMKGNIAHLV